MKLETLRLAQPCRVANRKGQFRIVSIDELADVIGLVSEEDFEENQLEATVHTRSRNIHRPRV